MFAITRDFNWEYPGICLVCGAVMNAGGKGYCTNHIKRCNGGGGIDDGSGGESREEK